MKDIKYSLTFWLILGTAFMVLTSYMTDGVIYDKTDWIFLFLIIGLIVLNVKLNKLLRKS